MKGYCTDRAYDSKFFKYTIQRIPADTKIPKECGVVHTVWGNSYEEVYDKLREWNPEVGKYFIYIEDELVEHKGEK